MVSHTEKNNIMTHLESRLQDREFTNILTVSQLAGLCYECDVDTAVIVAKLNIQQGQAYGEYRERYESNGEYVVLIIRNHQPKTIMYRRANQPMTTTALRVSSILDLTN